MKAWLCCGVYSEDGHVPLQRKIRCSEGEANSYLMELEEKYTTLTGQETDLERRYHVPKKKQVSFADESFTATPQPSVRRSASILKTRSSPLSDYSLP